MFAFVFLSAYLAEDFLISQTLEHFQVQVFFSIHLDKIDSTANTAVVYLPIAVQSAKAINPQRA